MELQQTHVDGSGAKHLSLPPPHTPVLPTDDAGLSAIDNSGRAASFVVKCLMLALIPVQSSLITTSCI